MIFTKVTHESAQFQIFDCSGEISSNLHFDRLEELCPMILKRDAKFEEKSICCFKNDNNLVNFDPTTEKSQKFAL